MTTEGVRCAGASPPAEHRRAGDLASGSVHSSRSPSVMVDPRVSGGSASSRSFASISASQHWSSPAMSRGPSGSSRHSDLRDALSATRGNRSLFGPCRDELLERLEWSDEVDDYAHAYVVDDDAWQSRHRTNCVHVFDCWDYEGVPDTTWRFRDLSNVTPFEERLLQCLRREGAEFQPSTPPGAGALRGGLRLVMCDRPNVQPRMTMSRRAFEMVETELDLHDATVPAFLDYGGTFSLFTTKDAAGATTKIQIVMKAVQKVEVSNFLLSLTFDVTRRWTDAFICGDGMVFDRYCDVQYGLQERQLLTALVAGGPRLWTNPLLLPTALVQMCVRRALLRSQTLEARLIKLENMLGVTFAGRAGMEEERPQWPMDIDVKRATQELHSILPQILFMTTVASWQTRAVRWLLDTEASLVEKLPLGQHEVRGFEEIRQTIHLLAASADGLVDGFGMFQGRTQAQIDLLFSVVGQRDALISQKANDLNLEVARSTKEDSISMTTFTFITALFLPPSFIATLFSMSMFDWSDGDGGTGAPETVSSKFWIFWVVVVPLTLLTLGGWYLWYGHADRRWQRRLDEVDKRAESDPAARAEEKRRAKQEEDDRQMREKLEREKRRVIEALREREKCEQGQPHEPVSGHNGSWMAKLRRSPIKRNNKAMV